MFDDLRISIVKFIQHRCPVPVSCSVWRVSIENQDRGKDLLIISISVWSYIIYNKQLFSRTMSFLNKVL